MRGFVFTAAVIALVLAAPRALAQQGGAAGLGGAAGALPAGGIGGIGGIGGGSGGTSQGGEPAATSGGIGGRSGEPRDEGCACRTPRGEVEASPWLLLGAGALAWRRRSQRRARAR